MSAPQLLKQSKYYCTFLLSTSPNGFLMFICKEQLGVLKTNSVTNSFVKNHNYFIVFGISQAPNCHIELITSFSYCFISLNGVEFWTWCFMTFNYKATSLANPEPAPNNPPQKKKKRSPVNFLLLKILKAQLPSAGQTTSCIT